MCLFFLFITDDGKEDLNIIRWEWDYGLYLNMIDLLHVFYEMNKFSKKSLVNPGGWINNSFLFPTTAQPRRLVLVLYA